MPAVTKPELARWIASERKRHGWKAEELAARLTGAGYEVAVTTIRTWEAGRRPSADNLADLERLFGTTAPTERPADLEALVQSISVLVEEVRAVRSARVEWERGLLEALRELSGGATQSGVRGRGSHAGARR